ncbi:hypothetical protein K503DRAFT_869223 [Rhizopogon vinicolor AM-OR11-026]|uniref:Uncharacterized protein n=1 Tax=Rhizopogon vinicolor AM-OR11-026 TaxID=1314800 RepID=A0A1B7MMV3_9AGAM|nr:hypothetical protein K503DRAFT_869223 [Rhizopogon vinicolor AM-OR11-026]
MEQTVNLTVLFMSDGHSFSYQPLNSRRVYTFDECTSTRRIVIWGSFISILASFGFIVCGVYIWVTSRQNPQHVHGLLYFNGYIASEIYSMVLNLFVTAFTECAGVMHSTSLRFALFREHRVAYNSNLRLVHGSDKRTMNSATINTVMAFLLILSYASSSFIFQGINDLPPGTCAILATPTTILGIAILLQTCISLFALRDTDILTWSTSPFDTIPAFLSMHDRRSLEYHYPLTDNCACMCAVGMPLHPSMPLNRQPSAWDIRKGVRITIYILWALGSICMAWGGWVYAVLPQGSDLSWDFIPDEDNPGEAAIGGDYFTAQSGISFATWLSLYAALLLTQGGLTLGLHCAELVAGVVRDEMLWRRASKGGINSSSSWKYTLCLDNWLYIVLFIAKSVLHWIFSLSVTIIFYDKNVNNTLVAYTAGINFFFAQIFYLGFSIFTIATIFTVAARYHPKGAQPAAYGDIKTLLRLVDDWEENMYWGHKDNGPTYHAGTSKEKLSAVDRNQEYGGRCQRKNTYL